MKSFYTNFFQIKDTIYLRGFQNKKRFIERVGYQPYMFLEDSNGDFKTLNGVSVKKKSFQSISAAKDFIKQYKDISNVKIYGNEAFSYQFINDEFTNDFEEDLINVGYLDIEVASDEGVPDVQLAEKVVTAITVIKDNRCITLGYYPFESEGIDEYIHCKDERELLEKFLEVWQELDLDVVSGWFIEEFDIPYLINRIKKLLGPNKIKALSPFGIVHSREVDWGKTKEIFDIKGIAVLDYLNLYKKFTFTNHESYKLDYICSVELGEKKIDYSEYRSLNELYKKDHDKFIRYNIRDTRLIKKLNDKLKFIELCMAMAYKAKINYVDALTTVRSWDIICTNYLLQQKIVVPYFENSEASETIMGGYVKEPQIGMFENIASFDYVSLYPHIIMGWNISPEMFVKQIIVSNEGKEFWKLSDAQKHNAITKLLDNDLNDIQHENLSFTANGCLYKKDKQGFFPTLIKKLFDDRKEYRQKMLDAKKKLNENKTKEIEYEIAKWDNFQKSTKIFLNGAYGALCNRYFRFYNPDIAESVTSTGQMITRYTDKKLNEYFNQLLKTNKDYIIAADTDSCYLCFDDLIKKVGIEKEKQIDFIDQVCKTKIQPKLDEISNEIFIKTNAYSKSLQMKREAIANKALWRGRKMYILNVVDLEGVRYKEPELIMHGIEAVRSSTPHVCRDKIKDCLKIIMNGTEEDLQSTIKSFKEKFFEMSVEDIAFPRGVSRVDEFADPNSIYIKGTPVHAKGSLIYNHMIKQKKLDEKYQLIYNGSKVKFLYLTLPNPARCQVIATPDFLPEELELHDHIDRDMQFRKAFLNPIISMTDLMGWKVEKTASLESLFE